MSLEENKAIYRRYIQEAFNKGHLEVLDELLSPSYVYQDAPPDIPAGPAGIKHLVNMFRSAFPDLHISIEEQAAEGNKVFSRSIMTGTHKGELFGIKPTGKCVSMKGMTMVKVEDGKIIESWVSNDVMGMMKQLGAIPAPAAK